MSKKCFNKYSLSSVITEMPIRTTLRFHHILVRMAKIQKTTDNKRWRAHTEKGALVICWWGCKQVQLL